MSRPGSALRLPSLRTGASIDDVISGVNKISMTLAHDLESLVLYQSVASPAQLTAAQNNYAIGSARVVRMSSDASRTITGFRGGVPNQELTLVNVGSFNIVLAHQSGSSDAGNRFLLEVAGNLTLGANDSVTLYYDQATARWRDLNVRPISGFSGTITYSQLPTGNGSWDTGAGTTITITRALIVSGLLTASTEVITPSVDTGGAVDLVLQRNNVTKITIANALTTLADPTTISGLLTASGKIASPLTIGTSGAPVVLTEGANASLSLGGDSTWSRTTGSGLTANVPVRLKNYTVATLPTGNQGDVAYVTNAVAPTYLVALTGGGTVVTPCFFDGTNWVAF